MAKMHNVEDVKRFMLGGNATFTILNSETHERITYRIRKPNEKTPYFVQFMNGPDNESSFSYLCTVFENAKKHVLKFTAKSPDKNSKAARGFTYLWSRVMTDGKMMPEPMEFWHEGTCGVCGRKLTDPHSIETGIGPVCAGRM